MSFNDMLNSVAESQTGRDALLGAAGAAAMAATDWSSSTKAFRHVFVGCITAAVGSDSLAPLLSSIISVLPMPDGYSRGASVFLVGATGIYMFEYVSAFLKVKIRSLGGKPNGTEHTDVVDISKSE